MRVFLKKKIWKNIRHFWGVFVLLGLGLKTASEFASGEYHGEEM